MYINIKNSATLSGPMLASYKSLPKIPIPSVHRCTYPCTMATEPTAKQIPINNTVQVIVPPGDKTGLYYILISNVRRQQRSTRDNRPAVLMIFPVCSFPGRPLGSR
jgi:hypothetical protein